MNERIRGGFVFYLVLSLWLPTQVRSRRFHTIYVYWRENVARVE